MYLFPVGWEFQFPVLRVIYLSHHADICWAIRVRNSESSPLRGCLLLCTLDFGSFQQPDTAVSKARGGTLGSPLSIFYINANTLHQLFLPCPSGCCSPHGSGASPLSLSTYMGYITRGRKGTVTSRSSCRQGYTLILHTPLDYTCLLVCEYKLFHLIGNVFFSLSRKCLFLSISRPSHWPHRFCFLPTHSPFFSNLSPPISKMHCFPSVICQPSHIPYY